MRSVTRNMLEGLSQPKTPKLDYMIQPTKLSPSLSKKFIQLTQDTATNQFLEHCNFPTWSQLFGMLIRPFANAFYSPTTTNGWLDIGHMFVMSLAQCKKLVGSGFNRALDIGAGDGEVTKEICKVAKKWVCTEVCPEMVKRLREKGFLAIETADLKDVQKYGDFDLICLLNVIDRCSKPVTLLKECLEMLKTEKSRLLLAVPLPFEAFVEDGTGQREPEEKLLDGMDSDLSWEESAQLLVDQVFEKLGFHVECFTRLPYISQGDLAYPYYVLDGSVFVLSNAKLKK